MLFAKGRFNILSVDTMQPGMDDPATPIMDRLVYADYYTKIHRDWKDKLIPSPPKTQIQAVRTRLETIYQPEQVAAIMDKLSAKKVFDNPALVQFLIDHGAKSQAFMEALQVAPAVSILRTAFGQRVDGAPLVKPDPLWWWPFREPMFIFGRYRAHLEAYCIRDKATVVILGLGYAPGLQILEKQPALLPARIIACDIDPSVISWAQAYATTPNMQGRLDFRAVDLLTTLKSLDDNSQDVISMLGIASYCVEKLPFIIPQIMSKLKPSGILLLDLQVREWSLSRCIDVFGWQLPGFTPSATVGTAVRTMQDATCSTPLASAEYFIDPRIDDPIGVVFTLQKP